MADNTPRFKWFSPVVKARFPNLAEARRYRDPETKQEEGEPFFNIGGILSDKDEPSVRKAFEDALKQLKPAKSKATKVPLSEDAKSGEIFISAKSSDKFKPLVVDARNHKLSDEAIAKLGGGSLVRLYLTLSYYKKGVNEGLTAYLNQVQVIKYVERGDNGASAFDEVKDGFEADEGQRGSAFTPLPSAIDGMHNF